MKGFFLLFILSIASAADKAEEARKAAEVFGDTYQAPQANDKSDVLIDFAPADVMNDEEKDVVLANYERTKAEYKEDISDTLFEKVSKAYVRNLDRILVKKKTD